MPSRENIEVTATCSEVGPHRGMYRQKATTIYLAEPIIKNGPVSREMSCMKVPQKGLDGRILTVLNDAENDWRHSKTF